MNKKIILVGLVLVVLSLAVYFISTNNKSTQVINVPPTTTETAVVYKNSDYGFKFSLPNDWRGYSIVKNAWNGNSIADGSIVETGPKLLIRNPNWTSSAHYEDIPILVFTLAQWKSYSAENFSVSAAPIPASEIARNNTYVFALPPRWDFDYSLGYKEAESIVNSKPLIPFNL